MKKSLILLATMTASIALGACSHDHRQPPMSPEMASCHQQIRQLCPTAMGPEQVGECLVQQQTSLAQICPDIAAMHAAKNQCEDTIDKLCPNATGPEQVGECLAKQNKTFAQVCPMEAEEKQKHHDEWKERHPDMDGEQGHW
jgi:hypothetical protein